MSVHVICTCAYKYIIHVHVHKWYAPDIIYDVTFEMNHACHVITGCQPSSLDVLYSHMSHAENDATFKCLETFLSHPHPFLLASSPGGLMKVFREASSPPLYYNHITTIG